MICIRSFITYMICINIYICNFVKPFWVRKDHRRNHNTQFNLIQWIFVLEDQRCSRGIAASPPFTQLWPILFVFLTGVLKGGSMESHESLHSSHCSSPWTAESWKLHFQANVNYGFWLFTSKHSQNTSSCCFPVPSHSRYYIRHT